MTMQTPKKNRMHEAKLRGGQRESERERVGLGEQHACLALPTVLPLL